MKVLIIEDEINTAIDLKDTLLRIHKNIEILDILDSIEAAVVWFEEHQVPDLVFSDIQLADGLSFEIFKKVKVNCPVIFCTAFNEYAIKAFEANGIDYILKPVNDQKLSQSLEKIDQLSSFFNGNHTNDLTLLLNALKLPLKPYKKNFLVSYGERMIPFEVNDIAGFYTENGNCYLLTYHNKIYTVTYTMEQLEHHLDPLLFYRANRQYIIAFKSIKAVEPYFSRKLFVHTMVKFPTDVIISKQKATSFLNWMEENH